MNRINLGLHNEVVQNLKLYLAKHIYDVLGDYDILLRSIQENNFHFIEEVFLDAVHNFRWFIQTAKRGV